MNQVNLECEKGEFKDANGRSVEYTRYYVLYAGAVKVYLKPADNTAKELLNLLLRADN